MADLWPDWIAKYDIEGFCRACGFDLDFGHEPWCLIPERDAEIVRLRKIVGHPIIQTCLAMNRLQFPEIDGEADA